jgi:hypothetical protein
MVEDESRAWYSGFLSEDNMKIIEWLIDVLKGLGQLFAEPDKPSTPLQRAYDAGYEEEDLDAPNPFNEASDRHSAWERGRRERTRFEERLW